MWLLRRLGYPGRDAVLRFDRIGPAWLCASTKRWARWRLLTGTGASGGEPHWDGADVLEAVVRCGFQARLAESAWSRVSMP